MSVYNFTLSVPQYSISTGNLLLLNISYVAGMLYPAYQTTFTNVSILTNDPIYGSLFTITSNSLIYLTGLATNTLTPAKIYSLKTLVGDIYNITLKVSPPSFIPNGSSYILYNGDNQTNLPIAISPPTGVFAYMSYTNPPAFYTPTPNVRSVSSRRTINGSTFNSGYITPSLGNLGLITTVCSTTAVVEILGTPIRTRQTTNNYTYVALNSSKQQILTNFNLQILPGRFFFTGISGVSFVSTESANITLNYLSNIEFDLSVYPKANVQLSPDLINLGLVATSTVQSGNTTKISITGAPTRHLYEPLYTNIFLSSPTVSLALSLTVNMNQYLEFSTDSSLNAVSNIVYTSSYPLQTFSANNYSVSSVIIWTLSSSKFTLDKSTGSNVNLIGGTSSAETITIQASSGGLSVSYNVPINVIADSIIVVDPSGNDFDANTGRMISNADIYQNKPFSFQFSAYSPVCAVPNIYTFQHSNFINGFNLSPTGLLTEIAGPSSLYSLPFIFKVSNSQGLTTYNRYIYFNYHYDSIIIDGYLTNYILGSPLSVIQNRDIRYDHYDTSLSTSAYDLFLGTRCTISSHAKLPPGLSLSTLGVLSGTPTFSGLSSFSIIFTNTYSNLSTSATVYVDSRPDTFIQTSPGINDFCVVKGSTTNVQFSGAMYSSCAISGYSLTNSVNNQCTISPSGYLTIVAGTNNVVGCNFEVVAQTTLGTMYTVSCTLTVNDTAINPFIPSPGSTIVVPYNTSYKVYSNLLFSKVSFSGSPFTLMFSNIKNLVAGTVYPPIFSYISYVTTSYTLPLRLATTYPSIIQLEPQNWIEYVEVSILISTTSPLFCTIVGLPPGLYFDPLTNLIGGSPKSLVVGGRFTVYGTDGYITTSMTVLYTVRLPTYLRGFSSPSAYTNYVSQQAIIRGSHHAIDNLAFLPAPLIASESGNYPDDVSTNKPCCPPK